MICSDVESEVSDVAVLHDIIFSFDPHEAFFPGCRVRSAVEELFIVDRLCLLNFGS